MDSVRVSLLGAPRRVGRVVADAFAPPGLAGGVFQRLARALYRVRLLVGISALGVWWALPGATARQRVAFVLLVGLLYLPYAFVLYLLSRRSEGAALRIAGVAGDLGIVFLFQTVLPPTRIVALFGYLLILAFYGYIGGLTAGAIVSALAMGLTLTAQALTPAAQRIDLYTLAMYGAVLVSMTALVHVATREQRQLTRRLMESEAGLQEAQQIAHVGNWEWDIPADRVMWSDEMYRIYGHRPQEFSVTFEKAMERVVPEDAERIRGDLEGAFREGKDYEFPGVEYRIVLPGGEERVLYGRGRLDVSEEGRPLRMVGTVQDITEQKWAEEVLRLAYERERQAGDRLRELDQMKNVFLTAVSHDLRTPLTSVLGFAKTLEVRLPHLKSEDAQAMAERISANAERLERMLLNLLDLDRISRGILEPKRAPTDVASLVRTVVESTDLRGRRVEVEGGPLIVEVDAAQVERIVENLLVNAVRHTPDGTRVWVRVRPEGDGALLAVEDEGPGVPGDLKEAIFQAFSQGEGAHASGAGVGLSLVAGFARLHGGRAWVEDRPGGGASFRVSLPGSAAGDRRESPRPPIAERQ